MSRLSQRFAESGLKTYASQAKLWQKIQEMAPSESIDPVRFPERPKHYRRTTKRVERLEHLARAIATAKSDPHIVRAEASVFKDEMVRTCHGACQSCDARMPDESMLHMHHVVPISRGGTNAPHMLALLCPNCHAKAHWIDRNAKQKPANAIELIAALRVA